MQDRNRRTRRASESSGVCRVKLRERGENLEAILSFLADAFIWCGIGSVSRDNKKKEWEKKFKKIDGVYL